MDEPLSELICPDCHSTNIEYQIPVWTKRKAYGYTPSGILKVEALSTVMWEAEIEDQEELVCGTCLHHLVVPIPAFMEFI